MNDKIYDVAANVVNKNRKYQHTTDKQIKTEKKTKKVKRETIYRSDPSIAVAKSDLATIVTLANYIREDIENKTDLNPYLEDILSQACRIIAKYSDI